MRIVVPTFNISSYYERRAKQLMPKRREPTLRKIEAGMPKWDDIAHRHPTVDSGEESPKDKA